jgi:L-fuconolactonase
VGEQTHIIDGQLHEPGLQAYWKQCNQETRQMAFTETLQAILSAVGVYGAILHPLEDRTWAQGLAERFPDRFAVVYMLDRDPLGYGFDAIDPDRPDLEQVLTDLVGRPGTVAFRWMRLDEGEMEFGRREGAGMTLSFCERQGIPVFAGSTKNPELWGDVAKAFPQLQIILDQMGMVFPPIGDNVWASLPILRRLAEFPNMNVKMTGVPAFSKRSYPFEDVVGPIKELVDCFGANRLMWASDMSRFQGQIGTAINLPETTGDYIGKHTYAESVGLFRDASWLSDVQKEEILGGTARRLLGWPRLGDTSSR